MRILAGSSICDLPLDSSNDYGEVYPAVFDGSARWRLVRASHQKCQTHKFFIQIGGLHMTVGTSQLNYDSMTTETHVEEANDIFGSIVYLDIRFNSHRHTCR